VETKNIINSINLSNINLNEETQYNFITETLIPFDQMLRATTIDLWHHHKEKNKQIKAFNNLLSKLASQDTLKATAATAAAISKASEIYNNSQNTNLQTNLRLSSLEKSFRKQELNQNEFQKSLKKTNNTKMPKIKHQLKSNKEKDILDLTTEDKTHLQIPQRRYLLQFNTTH
jgi:hypothetical protein